ncbi:hypothetical protein K449DRAFT_393957 [Hypoxylon sp. EC38]|nr:hypothetical protein K449DRAFT_393957 [Hypoxylon sp. EC38]
MVATYPPSEAAPFWALRARRISSKASLGKLPADTVFVAVDVEPRIGRRGSTKINFAILPKLEKLTWTPYGKQTLGDFVLNHGVEVFSYKLESLARQIKDGRTPDPTKNRETGDRVLEALHLTKPVRTRHRETALSYAVNQLRQLRPGKKLVIVGYSLQGELMPIGLNVLNILRRFDNWIDLCDLGGYYPKHLVNPFDILNDRSNHYGLDQREIKATRAIKHLSILYGLLHPRQVKHEKMEVASDVNHFSALPYQAMIEAEFPYTLPPSIYSARELARAFERFEPIGVAADCRELLSLDYRASTSTSTSTSTIDTPHMLRGCICFETRKKLRKFIKATKDFEIDGYKIYVRPAPTPRSPPKRERGELDMTLDFRRSMWFRYRQLVKELGEVSSRAIDWD